MQEKSSSSSGAARSRPGDSELCRVGTPTAITRALVRQLAWSASACRLPDAGDKTRGSMSGADVEMTRQRLQTTSKPAHKVGARFTESDRIALPAPKGSVQATMLQMIAEKTFGNSTAERLTVAEHPDGNTASFGSRDHANSPRRRSRSAAGKSAIRKVRRPMTERRSNPFARARPLRAARGERSSTGVPPRSRGQ